MKETRVTVYTHCISSLKTINLVKFYRGICNEVGEKKSQKIRQKTEAISKYHAIGRSRLLSFFMLSLTIRPPGFVLKICSTEKNKRKKMNRRID